MEKLTKALELCKESLESWSLVQKSSCRLRRLVGSSNYVYLLETEQNVVPKRVIYRVFGSESVIDLEKTSKVFRELSFQNLAPKIYKETPFERIEEFLENTRNIAREQLFSEHFAYKIGTVLKNFHSIDMSGVLSNSESAPSKLAKQWREKAIANLSSSHSRSEEIQEALKFLEPEHLENFLKLQPCSSPVVFSHLDTSYLNILYKEAEDQVCLIDYDYSDYAFRGFDIAMLLEDLKYDYNYPEYPFFEYDLSFSASDKLVADYVKGYQEGPSMWVEVKCLLIAVNYFWGVWCLALYTESHDSVDMLGMGLLRLRDFEKGYLEYLARGAYSTETCAELFE